MHHSISACARMASTVLRNPQSIKQPFPHLRELVLARASHIGDCTPTDPKVARARLRGLVQQWGCTLTLLALREPGIPLSDFESIIGMSAITSLTVNAVNDMEACLQSIKNNPNLPNLRELEIMLDMEDSRLFVSESLLSLVKARWNSIPRLAKLTLTDWCWEDLGLDVAVLQQCTTSSLALSLLELREAGLEVCWEIDEIDVMKEAYEYRRKFL